LKLSKGKIYLTDYKSKFGTLVLLQKQVQITPSKLCLQIGRTIAELNTAQNEKPRNKSENNISECLKEEKGPNSANDKFIMPSQGLKETVKKDSNDYFEHENHWKSKSPNDNSKTRRNRHSSK